MKHIIALSIALQIFYLHAQSCPFSWDPAPCYCNDDGDGVFCNKTSKIISTSQLIKIFRSSTTNQRLNTLFIKDAELENFNGSRLLNNVAFREIIISRTKTTSISNDALKGQYLLDDLKFSSNQFERFDFKAISHLNFAKLSIRENPLVDLPENSLIPLANMSIKTIDFSYNNLTVIRKRTFHDFPVLQKIILSGNEINTIEEHAFHLLVPYQPILEIYLNGNNLTWTGIHKDAFPAGLKLKTLFLSFNQMTSLPMHIFEPILEVMADIEGSVLEVSGNPFICDVYLYWLISKPEPLKNIVRGLVCPNGKTLKELTFNDLVGGV